VSLLACVAISWSYRLELAAEAAVNTTHGD